MKKYSEMTCIRCNRELKEGIGHYRTITGPLCVVCHDMEIEAEELMLKNEFQISSHQEFMKDQDETN